MDRLLAIIDYLRGRDHTTTALLAAHLGVSERTVRRDLARLRALDIPVETEPGRLGGVRLKRGALLPALRFTDDEALVLALGLRWARLAGDVRFADAADSAFRRLEHVLSGELGGRVAAALEALNLEQPPAWNLGQISSDTLLTLLNAAQHRERLHIRYRTAQGQGSDRQLDPYGVVHLVGSWYVAGHCHLRQDLRTFRVDRLQVLERCEETFDVPADFDALETVGRSLAQMASPESVTCRLWVRATVEEVRMWLPRYRASLEQQEDGVLIRLRAEPWWFREIALGLLQFSGPVQVLEPPALHATFSALAVQAEVLAQGRRAE